MTNNSTSLANLFDGKSDRCGSNQADVHGVALLLIAARVRVIFGVGIAIDGIVVVSLVRIGVVLDIGVSVVGVAVGVIGIAVGIVSIAVRVTVNSVGVTTVAGVAVGVIGV